MAGGAGKRRLPVTARIGLHGGLALSYLTLAIMVACASSSENDVSSVRSESIATPVPSRSGEDVFASICATCHGTEGQGQPNWHVSNEDGTLPAPPLNGDGHAWHHSDGFLYRVVQHGGKFQEDPVLLPGFKSAMPAFGSQLNHEETIAVISYIKSLWGDKTSRGLLIRDAQANASVDDPFPDN